MYLKDGDKAVVAGDYSLYGLSNKAIGLDIQDHPLHPNEDVWKYDLSNGKIIDWKINPYDCEDIQEYGVQPTNISNIDFNMFPAVSDSQWRDLPIKTVSVYLLESTQFRIIPERVIGFGLQPSSEPLRVWHIKENLLVIDGHHRLCAAYLVSDTHAMINVRVYEGE